MEFEKTIRLDADKSAGVSHAGASSRRSQYRSNSIFATLGDNVEWNLRNQCVSMRTRALEFRMRVLPAGDPSIAQTQFLLRSVTMLNGI
jgi:hypothetical protein